jgi:glyoxylase-like metal-dependent hydrolase (beta-lactamase superfamily II)
MADNDDIPFNRDFPLKPGMVDEIRPGVRRILCNNPSPFTFTGTVSYIVGRGNVAIIDPGPDDEAHAAALLDAVRGETVTHILVTHTHRDHSPNTARIKAATGATVCAEGPHRASPHRQPPGFRVAESKDIVRGRPCDGLVDIDRGAAGWIDDRLHDLAGTADATRGGFVFFRPRT